MLHKCRYLIALVPVALILAPTVFSRGGGVIPGQNSVPAAAARSYPSCVQCHSGSGPNSTVVVGFTPTQRALNLGETIQVTTSASSPLAGTTGGFIGENTAGAFNASGNTQVDATKRFVTHTNNSTRSWTYGYAAPNSAGPVELYTVAMTSNGSGQSGDRWAFFGSDPTSTVSTPVYLYVNAAGVQRNGPGCAGPFGNWPVLGAKQAPTAGNQQFAFELVGAPSASAAVLLIGLAQTPLSLTPLATGCFLSVLRVADLPALTSGTPGSMLAEGKATFALPIPSNARGVVLGVQAVVVGSVPGRNLPITTTNGLTITIS